MLDATFVRPTVRLDRGSSRRYVQQVPDPADPILSDGRVRTGFHLSNGTKLTAGLATPGRAAPRTRNRPSLAMQIRRKSPSDLHR